MIGLTLLKEASPVGCIAVVGGGVELLIGGINPIPPPAIQAAGAVGWLWPGIKATRLEDQSYADVDSANRGL